MDLASLFDDMMKQSTLVNKHICLSVQKTCIRSYTETNCVVSCEEIHMEGIDEAFQASANQDSMYVITPMGHAIVLEPESRCEWPHMTLALQLTSARSGGLSFPTLALLPKSTEVTLPQCCLQRGKQLCAYETQCGQSLATMSWSGSVHLG